MTNLTINNTPVSVSEDTTVLEAAQKLNIYIPTMCWVKNLKPSTSCMVCLVKDQANGAIFTSCSVPANNGMDIITESDELTEMRKSALELLLSEHQGDCDAPCQRVCPAGMDIPQMNRLIAERKFAEAIEVVKETIPIPSILGYVCPAPCENACRRADIDEPVSICLLKRIVAEEELFTSVKTKIEESGIGKGKSVAIIGSGPLGLTTAYYLAQKSFDCTIFDNEEKPGGKLRTEISEEKLPTKVLDSEIEEILKMGVQFMGKTKLTTTDITEKLAAQHDFIIYAGGFGKDFLSDDFKPIEVDRKNQISLYKVGNSQLIIPKITAHKSKMAVKSVGIGQNIVKSIEQILTSEEVKGTERYFNSFYSKIAKNEQSEFLKEAENHTDRTREKTHLDGFTTEQAVAEARRCLHCDCRAKDDCTLRDLSDMYKAKQRKYVLTERKNVSKAIEHDKVIYESLKCIKCGLCVQVSGKNPEDVGFAFIGRGFDKQIGFPLQKAITEAIDTAAEACAKVCPTGAISLK